MVRPRSAVDRPPAQEPVSGTWRRSLRWFLSEFLVVVSGVLVALVLQSWFQARQNVRTEREFLAQLESDLESSRQMLQSAIHEDSIRLDANARLLAALRRGTLPPVDSARSWLRLQLGFFSDPRPVLGTVHTLIETGDIRLIRDARLRSQVVAYASLMASDNDELGRTVTRLTQANDAERARWEKNGLEPLEPTGTTAASLLPGRFSHEDAVRFQEILFRGWPVLANDTDLRGALVVRRIAFALRVFYLNRMLASTNEIHAMVSSQNARS